MLLISISSFIYDTKNGNNVDRTMSLNGHATNDRDISIHENHWIFPSAVNYKPKLNIRTVGSLMLIEDRWFKNI